MFEFGYTWAFFLLPVPFLLYWILPVFKQRKEALRFPPFDQAVTASGKKAKSKAWIAKRNIFQWLLLTFVWLCLLTALASPRLVGEPELKVKTARNFVIAADISFSMANTDWFIDDQRVTRWEGVKQVMRSFIRQRQSDRIALVFFGTNAYLQAPLTTDHDVIEFMLEETDVGMAGQMTSIGKAIGYSLQIFEGDSLEQKVLLLLTDGQDDGRGIFPTDAARMAHQDSVKIYTIGIGEPTGNNSGLDENTLKSIASISDGQYFLAQDAMQLKQAYKTLNQLEPVEFEEEDNKPVSLLYHYPLAVGLCLAFTLAFIRGVIQLIRR